MTQVKPSDFDSITITLNNDDYESNDSYVWGNSDTITLSDIVSGSSNTAIGGITVPWTTATSISGNGWSNRASSKIQLNGPDADIEINGDSLIDMLQNIENRLSILKPNPELESEWTELRSLGEQYRALEKHILEKQATWDRLKAMPPPEIT